VFVFAWIYCSWAATQVIGLPNVYPKHGDFSGTWAVDTGYNGQQYIEVMMLTGSLFIRNFIYILIESKYFEPAKV